MHLSRIHVDNVLAIKFDKQIPLSLDTYMHVELWPRTKVYNTAKRVVKICEHHGGGIFSKVCAVVFKTLKVYTHVHKRIDLKLSFP